MRKSWTITFGVMAAVLLAISFQAQAIEPIPTQSGFSGYVQPGVGYLNIKSNMVAEVLNFELSDKKIDSIDDEPDDQSTVLTSIPFEIDYTFGATRTQLFLGSELTDLLRLDFYQQLGVRQEIGSLGSVQAGFLFGGIPTKVWKDPYVEGENRKETSRDSMGGRLVWDRILGSGLQLQYTYRKIDISSEKSGTSPALGLSSSDRNLLDRNGDYHEGTALYRFKLGEKHRLIPEFRLGYDNRDGDARTNTAYDFVLTYSYRGDPITLILNGSIGYADYDKKNPIYGKTQEDDRYSGLASVYYKNPWGWGLFGSQPMQFFVTGAYVAADSNIDFYTQEAVLGMGGVLFRW